MSEQIVDRLIGSMNPDQLGSFARLLEPEQLALFAQLYELAEARIKEAAKKATASNDNASSAAGAPPAAAGTAPAPSPSRGRLHSVREGMNRCSCPRFPS